MRSSSGSPDTRVVSRIAERRGKSYIFLTLFICARRLHAAISCCVFVVFGKQLLCIKRVFALTRAPASSPANDIGALLSVPRDDHGFLLPGSSRSGHATTFRASVSLSPIVRVDKLKPSMWALTRSRFDFAQMRIRNDARC